MKILDNDKNCEENQMNELIIELQRANWILKKDPSEKGNI